MSEAVHHQNASPPAISGAFRVDAPTEIAALLRCLIDGQVPVTLAERSGVSLVTALWAADEHGRRLVFNADPGKPEVQALVLAGEGEATAYVDNVKLQIDLDDLVLVHGRGASAFHARYPNELYRFQKRDSFRVQPLSHTRPTIRCALPGQAELRARVLDLSHSGIAILWPAGSAVPVLGNMLEQARLQVDPHTEMRCALRVVHVGNPGEQGVRLGCELFDLSIEDGRALQRYLDHTQRRQRMLVL
jgi:c-di-GMP-binding flagellar brake protein YcgR